MIASKTTRKKMQARKYSSMFKNSCKIRRISFHHPVIDMLNNFFHIWSQRRFCFNTASHEEPKLYTFNSVNLRQTFFWVWWLPDTHFTKKNTITVHVSLWEKIQRKIRLQNRPICQNSQLVSEIVLLIITISKFSNLIGHQQA